MLKKKYRYEVVFRTTDGVKLAQTDSDEKLSFREYVEQARDLLEDIGYPRDSTIVTATFKTRRFGLWYS